VRNKSQLGLWKWLLIVAVSGIAFGQTAPIPPIPSLIEVYWHSSQTEVIPGITNVIVLDQDIARAELGDDTVRFVGLERGETVALGYINGQPLSIRLRIVERPQIELPPTLGLSEMAQGIVSSSLQTSSVSGMNTLAVSNGFSWSQAVGKDGHLNFSSQIEDANYAGGHVFNPRTANLIYSAPQIEIQALDFSVNLTNGETQRYMGPYALPDTVAIRGLDVTTKRGINQYSLYAGTTLPSFYLTLGATRDLAGVSFQRKQTNKLTLFASTSFVSAPADVFGLTPGRRDSLMDLGGLNYLMSSQWAMQATVGASIFGGLARGTVSYAGKSMTFYATATTSAALFPLNQIESLYSGTSSSKAGWTLKSTNWLSESFNYQHTVTPSADSIIKAGSADFVSPAVSIRLPKGQDVNFTYTYSRNSGGFANGDSTGNRFDIYLNSHLNQWFSNSVQVGVGSIQDPLQVNSEDQFSIQDTVSMPIKAGTLFLGASYNRTNPSLVSKLNSELSLLAPALQNLYLQDPVSFVDSPNLPPEIKALLESQQPIDLSFSASGQFRIASKLNLTPNFSLAKTSNGVTESWSPFLSYGLSYRLRPSLLLTSSMNTGWVLSSSNNSGSSSLAQRTNLFSFGVTKSFSAAPILLGSGPRGRVIEGHVFRDDNINGVFNVGEPGLPNIHVQLEDGQSVTTDKHGYFRFQAVSASIHRVSIHLAQFSEPIRLTCASEQQADVIRQRSSVVDFGIINFARLMGNVFNDLRFENALQPDSKGMAEIHLILDDGKQKRTIVSEGTGEYQVDDIPPGDYQLSVDRSTLPANYVVPIEAASVQVKPVSTVLQNFPVRALRSISGRVLLKVPDSSISSGKGTDPNKSGAFKLIPLQSVQLTAGYGTVKTDENGDFLLRNLPAGNLTVSLVPLRPLAEGMKLPSGTVRMPSEPIEVQGATIVISNPDLVPYLQVK
jgi:hypothetical protein